ncbi:MAG: LPS export ABC transporter periplasmic protein LptC [Deltaproteobacteria bacterium]|nr:LPS export ABC transporter periplasmic protein LptC [Deltaproteobacteria bacterium]
MEKIRKRKILLVSFIVLFCIGFFIYKSNNHNYNLKKRMKIDSKVKMSLKNVFVSESTGGKIRWEIQAAKLAQFGKNDIVKVEKVKALFYTKDGTKVQIKGKTGEIKIKTKDITLSGDVEIIYGNEYKMSTPSLFYRDNNRTITTEDLIKIESNNFFVQGVGLVIELKSERVILNNKVKAKIFPFSEFKDVS